MNKVDIEQIITEARAEEEAARENADFLEDGFSADTVTIPVSEYIVLHQTKTDFARLHRAIMESLSLSWNKKALVISGGDRIVEALRFLHPDYIEDMLHKKQAQAEKVEDDRPDEE